MLDSIKAKILVKVHKQPYGTEKLIRTNDIVVPYKFRQDYAKPKEWKMERARSFYKDHGYVDKPLSVRMIANRNGNIRYLLRDEYTRYLVLKEIHSINCPVKLV